MSPSTARLQLIETPPDRAVTRLHRLVRQRDVLRADFRNAWDTIAADCADAELEAWSAAAIELAFVNAGPPCLLAFWRVSIVLRAQFGLSVPTAVGHACADVCRHAGAAAALACLQAGGTAARALGSARDLAQWSRGLVRLAREAPESVAAVAGRTDTILQYCDGAAFESFIATGLKAGGQDRARRRAFFALEDPLARQTLERAAGLLGFAQLERPLKAFATALWGRPPILRTLEPVAGRPAPRRAAISGGIIHVPAVFRGVSGDTAAQLFRACIAHASAHLALTPARLSVGQLKPLQVALTGLIEDARVEALAMRRFPGLRRVWAPFHVAVPAGPATAPALLARLARALFDPHFADDNGFVAKGRALFAAEAWLEDPALSRRIGGLLGNDLGQMRVQFNARTYVVEPAYRDDGLGLWDIDDPAAEAELFELQVEAVRVTRQDAPAEADRQREEAEQKPDAAGRARSVDADERGIVIAAYPEWDRAAGVERPDWVTVRDTIPALGDGRSIEAALDRAAAVRARIDRLVRGARIGRHERLRRRPDGPELDLDAALDAAIALRSGNIPDNRIYRSSARHTHDLAVTVLIDVSESTRTRVGERASEHASSYGGSVLDLQRLAVAALGSALAPHAGTFSLLAFASAGRDDVRVIRLKDFHEPYDASVRARLAGLVPGLSTRLGAALRHAGARIAPARAHRKLILVLTDGEPSDIDVADPRDLIEDARRATLSLKAKGIDVFGVTLDPSGVGSGLAVFGRGQHMPVRRLEDLPLRLAALYFRLARR